MDHAPKGCSSGHAPTGGSSLGHALRGRLSSRSRSRGPGRRRTGHGWQQAGHRPMAATREQETEPRGPCGAHSPGGWSPTRPCDSRESRGAELVEASGSFGLAAGVCPSVHLSVCPSAKSGASSRGRPPKARCSLCPQCTWSNSGPLRAAGATSQGGFAHRPWEGPSGQPLPSLCPQPSEEWAVPTSLAPVLQWVLLDCGQCPSLSQARDVPCTCLWIFPELTPVGHQERGR